MLRYGQLRASWRSGRLRLDEASSHATLADAFAVARASPISALR